MFRAPAITASLAGHADPAYTPDRALRAGQRVAVLRVSVSAEVGRDVGGRLPLPWQPLLAAAAHLLLVVAVAALRARLAWAYVAGYFVFLLPVLMLPNPGVHCLYGAALAMSLAMAAVLTRSWSTRRYGLAALVLAGAGALFAHDIVIQRHLSDAGQCQSRFLASVDALLATTPAGSSWRRNPMPRPSCESRFARYRRGKSTK